MDAARDFEAYHKMGRQMEGGWKKFFEKDSSVIRLSLRRVDFQDELQVSVERNDIVHWKVRPEKKENGLVGRAVQFCDAGGTVQSVGGGMVPVLSNF